ncbi:hypothetical protein ACFYZJ_38010 [Streptomyces sp. NPDC001848]|uniref:hypothetical protein n=1 Tax=Streptomyces sp. NPDC001848 TaxID=3364618 RepID=UPI0036A50A88
MLIDPYAVLHALLRAEAVRSTKPKQEPEPEPDTVDPSLPTVPPERSDRNHERHPWTRPHP